MAMGKIEQARRGDDTIERRQLFGQRRALDRACQRHVLGAGGKERPRRLAPKRAVDGPGLLARALGLLATEPVEEQRLAQSRVRARIDTKNSLDAVATRLQRARQRRGIGGNARPVRHRQVVAIDADGDKIQAISPA